MIKTLFTRALQLLRSECLKWTVDRVDTWLWHFKKYLNALGFLPLVKPRNEATVFAEVSTLLVCKAADEFVWLCQSFCLIRVKIKHSKQEQKTGDLTRNTQTCQNKNCERYSTVKFKMSENLRVLIKVNIIKSQMKSRNCVFFTCFLSGTNKKLFFVYTKRIRCHVDIFFSFCFLLHLQMTTKWRMVPSRGRSINVSFVFSTGFVCSVP